MNGTILLSMFTAVESAHAYSAFLPSIFTINTFVSSPEGIEAIRRGELYASLFALGLGAIISQFTKSAMPLLFTGATVVIMLLVYESSLRSSPAASA